MLPLAVIFGIAAWGVLVWIFTGGYRRKRRTVDDAPRWLRPDGRCITCGLPVLGPHVAETVNITHCSCAMRCLRCGKHYPRWSHHAPICTDPECRGPLMPYLP